MDSGKYALCSTYRDTSRKCLLSIAKINGSIDETFKDSFTPVVTDWEADFDEITNDGPVFYFKTNHNANRDKIVTFNVDKPEEV